MRDELLRNEMEEVKNCYNNLINEDEENNCLTRIEKEPEEDKVNNNNVKAFISDDKEGFGFNLTEKYCEITEDVSGDSKIIEVDNKFNINDKNLINKEGENSELEEKYRIGNKDLLLNKEFNFSGLWDSGDEEVAGARAENRHFFLVELAGESYKALFDPGAMLSLVGPCITDKFRKRLLNCNTSIRSVIGGVTKVQGILRLSLEIDGINKLLLVKVVDNLDQDIILGIDFCKLFDCDTRLGRGLWRVNEEEWRQFLENDVNNANYGTKIIAECAGITELDEV